MFYLQQVKISKTRFDKCSDFPSKRCRFLNEAKMTSILIARNSIYLFRNVEHKLHKLPSKSIYTSALRLCKSDVKKSKLNEFGRILGLAKQDRKRLTCKKRFYKQNWLWFWSTFFVKMISMVKDRYLGSFLTDFWSIFFGRSVLINRIRRVKENECSEIWIWKQNFLNI